jgi:CRISPR type III-A-associated protein Csm2
MVLNMHKHKANFDEVVNHIEKFVENYGKGLSTSQLRNIYAKMKKLASVNIEEKIFQLKSLRPQLAYITARLTADKENGKKMIGIMDSLIQQVKTKEQFDNFMYFMESVVAYHKFYHPKSA